MSHQVAVKFEGLSIQVKAQCDQAISSMCKIDKTLENINRIASKVKTKKMEEYEQYLLDAKSKLAKEIEQFKAMAESYKGKSMFPDTAQQLRDNFYHQAKRLIKVAAELTGSKLAVIDELVNEGLFDFVDSTVQNMQNEINGVKQFDATLIAKINEIEDISLKDLAFQQLEKGVNNFSDIMKNSSEEYNRLLNNSSFVKDLKSDLKTTGIPQNEIDELLEKPINLNNVGQIQEEAHTKIIDENIRKETLKVIIKSIRDRGFIVDT